MVLSRTGCVGMICFIWKVKLIIISYGMGFGKGTNMMVDILYLWGFLWSVRRLHVLHIHIIGDSKVIVDWENGISSLHYLAL